jgi:hypothetical protein
MSTLYDDMCTTPLDEQTRSRPPVEGTSRRDLVRAETDLTRRDDLPVSGVFQPPGEASPVLAGDPALGTKLAGRAAAAPCPRVVP